MGQSPGELSPPPPRAYLQINCHLYLTSLSLLQQISYDRTQQLQDLQNILEEISKEIMWVNDREEEELVFDWGDKNIDKYIPEKQDSYSVSEKSPCSTFSLSFKSINVLGNPPSPQ